MSELHELEEMIAGNQYYVLIDCCMAKGSFTVNFLKEENNAYYFDNGVVVTYAAACRCKFVKD